MGEWKTNPPHMAAVHAAMHASTLLPLSKLTPCCSAAPPTRVEAKASSEVEGYSTQPSVGSTEGGGTAGGGGGGSGEGEGGGGAGDGGGGEGEGGGEGFGEGGGGGTGGEGGPAGAHVPHPLQAAKVQRVAIGEG